MISVVLALSSTSDFFEPSTTDDAKRTNHWHSFQLFVFLSECTYHQADNQNVPPWEDTLGSRWINTPRHDEVKEDRFLPCHFKKVKNPDSNYLWGKAKDWLGRGTKKSKISPDIQSLIKVNLFKNCFLNLYYTYCDTYNHHSQWIYLLIQACAVLCPLCQQWCVRATVCSKADGKHFLKFGYKNEARTWGVTCLFPGSQGGQMLPYEDTWAAQGEQHGKNWGLSNKQESGPMKTMRATWNRISPMTVVLKDSLAETS